ncbi:MAG: nucleoside deaminase [Ignavibacteriae bacterium]|nr:MAG: nucleoside deaminase [Ignavibacteriota bacterium]
MVLRVLSYLLLFTFFASITVVTIVRLHRFKRLVKLPDHQLSRLLELARRSLESLDVPVGALLIYHTEIIGEGYNTVLRGSDAGGHAEINAISDAIKRLGMERFTSLERNSLFLVSTFEPCLMCAGAFINYDITRVYFLKEKDTKVLSKEGARFIRYYFRRGPMKHAGEQDALFEQHPGYPLRRVNSDAAR